MESNITYIDTSKCSRPKPQKGLLAKRRAMAMAYRPESQAEVSVVVISCNRLAKTRACVESILAYTNEVDYELLLIDSGSDDGTLDYFKAIAYKKKKIIRITKNLGGGFAFSCLNLQDIGSYLVFVANDIVVTKNWLTNLLACARSDARIGMVTPLASNASNLQGFSIPFRSEQEMQEKAAAFNQSNPKKWRERLRLVTLCPLFKKEALFAIGFPLLDPGFFHDFGDDDVTFRIRRMGYKAVLAGDTWIHHNHSYQERGAKNRAELQESLSSGRQDFQEKYQGIDAWDDVNQYYEDIIPHLPRPNAAGCPKILGIDVWCGTPALEIKNELRLSGIMDADIYSFTQDAKYVSDLKTICSGTVACDREEFMAQYYPKEFFDYILIGRPVNQYHEPQQILQDACSLAKKGGILVLALSNPLGIREYLNILGKRDVYNPNYLLSITPEALERELKKYGNINFCIARKGDASAEKEQIIRSMMSGTVPENHLDECVERLFTETFVFCLTKLL